MTKKVTSPIETAGKVEIFCRFVVRNGKKIYPKKGEFFHFWVVPKEAA